MKKDDKLNKRFRKFVSGFFNIAEEGFHGEEDQVDYWYKLSHPYFDVIDFEGSSIKLGVNSKFNNGEILRKIKSHNYYHTDAHGVYFVMMATGSFLMNPDLLNAVIFRNRLSKIEKLFN